MARHGLGKGWVQEELDLTCPASFSFRAKTGENSPREQTMSHRPRSRGCRHAGGGCPGPGAGRLRRAARACQAAEKEEGRREMARVPVCLHTYPRRGKVPAPARRLRPSSRGASESPEAGARRGAGRRRKGKRNEKRSRAVAQRLLPLGRAAAEPRGRREGRAGSLRQWRRPGPEGKRNNRRRCCAWPQPWGRATAGSKKGRGQDTTPPGPKPGASRGGDGHRFPMGGPARGVCWEL